MNRAVTFQGWEPGFAACTGQQGMSPLGMSVHHPSATGHGASTCQLWILVLLSPSQRCSLALPIPSPPPVPFTTPFLPLSLPSPHSQRLFLICCSPSPRRRQFCSRVLRIHHRPLPWDSALAGGSGSKLLGWQTSTWAHYSRAGDMVITCLRGRAAPPAPGMLPRMDTGTGQLWGETPAAGRGEN